MKHRQLATLFAGGLLALCAINPASAATRPHTLDVDLAPYIDRVASQRERFAVNVPHAASVGDAGEWQRTDATSVWRYSVRIPTAVSMSFHASQFKLPAGASLRVTGADGAAVSYVGGDGAGQQLWSRLHRGDFLSFELRVARSLESEVALSIDSLQAGYRVLGNGGADHPHYRKLQAADTALAAASASCSLSFDCRSTPANAHNGDATAAIVVGGVSLCTGTLVNNLRNDARPYLLTARHCQDTPHSGIVVYWDAVSACGQPLGSVYDTQTLAYIHTTETVFEQQDVWLIHLTGPINGNHVYFAGWDATGGTFVGGYSPHHALGRSRQYTEWFGQPVLKTLPGSALGKGYDSNYWGLVNSVGNVGSGASGSGLFNPDHRLVGVGSMATIDSSGEGACPAASPPAPTNDNVTALYSSLAAVWDTTADTTSFTNPVTLKMLLDPDDTGARVSDGFEMLTDVFITSNMSYQDTGRVVTLSWTGGTATSCTAEGGVAGDGWAGARSNTGTYEVTQYDASMTTYTIRCTAGAKFATRSVNVLWNLGAPQLFAGPSDSIGILGTSQSFFWRSTVVPCTAAGGRAGDGWAGAKSSANGNLTVPLLASGDTTYSITCGTGPLAKTETFTVRTFPPKAELNPTSTTIRVGSDILVGVVAYGVECTRSGGAPGDGWAGGSGYHRFTSATPGTFQYSLTCTGGRAGSPPPAVANMSLTFTNAAPAVTLTASQTTAEVGGYFDIPRYAIHFAWQSNVGPCQLSYDGPGDNDGPVHPSMDAPAAYEWVSYQSTPGIYVYRITCRNGADEATATTTVEYLATPPRVEIYVDTTVPKSRDQTFTLNWSSNVPSCMASGGYPGDGWAGAQSDNSGFPYISIGTAGTWTYTMTCGSGAGAVTSSIDVVIPPPSLTFEPHVSQRLMSQGIELRWNGTVGNCVKTGDWAADPFPLFSSGSAITSSGTPGLKTFGIRCGLSNYIEATTQVEFLPVPVVQITASPLSALVNQPVTLSWTSSFADECQVQGAGMADWNGKLAANGSKPVTRTTPGHVGFYIDCGGVVDAVVVEWRGITSSPPTPAAPAVTMSIDHPTRVAGETVVVTWTSNRAAACRGGQGVAGDGWTGALPVSGTRSIVVAAAGTYTWEISCEGAPPSATATVSAIFSAAPSGGSGSGGGSNSGNGSGSGGGGGGRIDPMLLAMLGFMLLPGMARAGRRRYAERLAALEQRFRFVSTGAAKQAPN